MGHSDTDGLDAQGGEVKSQDQERLLTPLTGLVAVLLLLCFAPYLRWMWEIWMRSEYYGHGPLVPLISAYLIYTRREEFRQAAGGRHLWGLLLVVPGLLLYAATVYLNVNFPQGFAMIMVIGGTIILLWGWGRAQVVLFPVTFLVFMVPVDRLLVTQFSLPLQLGGAAVASSVVAFLGVPVEAHGTTIVIPDYTFEVVQACSGLKSTIAMTALAAVFAYVAAGPIYKRVVLFISGIPLALLANGVRITFTLFLGRAFGAQAAEGFFHTFSGIMVFLIALLGLFLVAKVIGCDRIREDIW